MCPVCYAFRKSSGSFAIFTAIRRASSRGTGLAYHSLMCVHALLILLLVCRSRGRRLLNRLHASGLVLCKVATVGVAQADNRHANNGNKNLTGFLTQQDSCGWQLDSPRDAGAPSVVVAVWQLPSRKCSTDIIDRCAQYAEREAATNQGEQHG